MKTYKEKKSDAISEAIEWQNAFSDRVISYEELSEETEHFAKIAKRFGLIRMFKQGVNNNKELIITRS